MSPEINVNDYYVAIESTLGEIRSALNDIHLVLSDQYAMMIELYRAQIIIIVMLGVIAGACIFRHLRK